jgi:hypothetical protein
MMRLFWILTICTGIACAQDTGTNMQCVERLEMPVYPPLADAARISGTVTAVVAIASDGSIRAKTEGHVHLTRAVETAIRASKFDKACVGKSVTLVFNFELSLDLHPRQAFAYPNQFYIRSAARPVEP